LHSSRDGGTKLYRHRSVKGMRAASSAVPKGSIRDRILAAAFACIKENGFSGASTLDIANRARVSKRDLYALFPKKDDMLLACIAERATAISASLELPEPKDVRSFTAVLDEFGFRVLKAVTRSDVVTAFRFAIARSGDLPQLATILDRQGRLGSRKQLSKLLDQAIANGVLSPGETSHMVRTFFGLLWADLQVGLLLGVAKAPGENEMRSLAAQATRNFLSIHAGSRKAR
jgi:AcrR family transcriptional regulator